MLKSEDHSDLLRVSKKNASHWHDPFVHKLPVELASHIFELCIPYVDLFRKPDSNDSWNVIQSQANALASVCYYWRSLAFMTPTLWTSLVFDFRENGKRLDLNSIKEVLQRSGPLPLSFIAVSQDIKKLEGDFPVIDLLNAESYRWHAVHLRMSVHDLHRFSQSETGASGVHALTAYCGKLKQGEGHEGPFRISGALPRPVKVDLQNFKFTNICIDWSRAKDVKLWTYWEDRGFLSLLNAAPLLERCICSFLCHVNQEPFAQHPPLIHHSLQEFSGCLDGGALQSLTLPSLVHLDLMNYVPTPTVLRPLLERSSSIQALQSLTFMMTREEMAACIEMLLELVHLVDLEFCSNDLGMLDAFIDTYTAYRAESTPTRFLPSLETLQYMDYASTAIPSIVDWSKIPLLFPTEQVQQGDIGPESLVSHASFEAGRDNGCYFSPFISLKVTVCFPQLGFGPDWEGSYVEAIHQHIGFKNIDSMVKIRKRGFRIVVWNTYLYDADDLFKDIISVYESEVDAQSKAVVGSICSTYAIHNTTENV